ncbi:hypothetical protein KUTeg_019577 [Tegillarca granosa]|uniref:Uncharacterized protein n=1 Tax=Tegillarca granosa TaxID=220873 RepID=A0ABQ9EFI2_TEGGR|nr:hypothetical protein KUTeg_019577 [Tegillarca granosa]
MASGWGKRAASRIDRTQYSQDELLKSLGNQFNVDFSDYDQWKRRVKRPFPKKDGKAPTVGPRARSAELFRGNAPQTIREKKQAAKMAEIEKGKAEKIKIMEGGINTLSTNFSKEYQASQKELDEARERTESQMAVLEAQNAELDEKLKEKQEELHVLMSYKDKEYPVKAMKIATLQKEIQNLKITNQEDQEDLEHIINTELGKYEKERHKNISTITKLATEQAISLMHPSLKDMALQNMVMKKEIEFHIGEQEKLKRLICDLEHEVHTLLRDPKTNTRIQMFPEFFPTAEKCTPDMDVILDIPTQQWLPI